MVVFAKQQISYLNQHSQLDTLEDKQAKALKEIYKLCKTDEGESSDQIHDFYPPREEYDSDDSGKIKDLFEQMRDEKYDINSDLLLIQENDDEDLEDLLGDQTRNDAQQV